MNAHSTTSKSKIGHNVTPQDGVNTNYNFCNQDFVKINIYTGFESIYLDFEKSKGNK